MRQHDGNVSVIPKGAMFIVTSGEYSDYCIDCIAKAKGEIDTKEFMEEYLEENPQYKDRRYDSESDQYIFQKYTPDGIAFLAWLTKKYPDLFEEFTFYEWNFSYLGVGLSRERNV